MPAQARPAGTLLSKLLPMKSKWRAVRPQAVKAGISVNTTVRVTITVRVGGLTLSQVSWQPPDSDHTERESDWHTGDSIAGESRGLFDSPHSCL